MSPHSPALLKYQAFVLLVILSDSIIVDGAQYGGNRPGTFGIPESYRIIMSGINYGVNGGAHAEGVIGKSTGGVIGHPDVGRCRVAGTAEVNIAVARWCIVINNRLGTGRLVNRL